MYWQHGKECTHSAISYYDLQERIFKVSEQKLKGNVSTPIEKWLFENGSNIVDIAYPKIELLNLIDFLNFENTINKWATKDKGKIHYDVGGLFYYVWKKFIALNDPTSYYCSEQIGTYYREAKFEVVAGVRPSQQSPCMQIRQIGKRFDSVKDEIIKDRG
jgi:hypothetical protein